MRTARRSGASSIRTWLESVHVAGVSLPLTFAANVSGKCPAPTRQTCTYRRALLVDNRVLGADVTAAVVAVARTAVRATDGELAGWNPVVLAGVVGQEALDRAGFDAGALDEVVVGCADPVGACGADAARAIVLAAGWPTHVGGLVIDRAETSGMAAVQTAATAIQSGQARTVLVVGVGLCSVVPPGAAALNRTFGAPWGGVAERLAARGGLLPAPRLSEDAARAAGIGRAELDAAATESRRRRIEAGTSPSIVAVATRPGDAAGRTEHLRGRTRGGQRSGDATGRRVYRGDPVTVDVVRDWGDTAGLPPTFDDDGLLTAATFSPPADAVAAVLLQAESDARGAMATVTGMGRAAGDPFDPIGNVATAVGRALDGAGGELAVIDHISVVEHDAATATLVGRALGVDETLVNRDGGAVATGHAGAAEELRLITDGAGLAERQLLTISAGPTGSAAIVWNMNI